MTTPAPSPPPSPPPAPPPAPLLKLYSDAFYLSPYVFSVFVTLKEKEIPFDIELVHLEKGEQRSPGYRDRSLTGRVPSLEHHGFVLAESSAIVEYLEETFAPPQHARVLPLDARERARTRQIMAFLRSDLMPIREERPAHTMFYAKADRPLSDGARRAADRLQRIVELLVPDGRHSLFADWSIADAELAFMLNRLILNDHPVSQKVRAFADAQWARPSVRAFVERERAPYVPY
jgi:glutathione S-transferase